MTEKASQSFKEKLAGNNLVEALTAALSEAIELKITTWVSEADQTTQQGEQGKPGHRMQTRINIVDGDVETEIGELFLNQGPYAELREFHIQQVQKGQDTIRNNLESLQKLFGILGNMSQSGHRLPPQTVDVKPIPASSEKLLPPSQS
ncbi:MAG: hypothetical protein ACOYME_14480 [Prochlorotrichaceae cyanobacterium]|jgi:hypothetical protein